MAEIVQTTYQPLNPYGGKAKDVSAATMRAEYEEYKRTFVPLENELMKMTTYGNDQLLPDELAKSKAETDRTFNSFSKAPAIQLSRYGNPLTGDQQAVSDRLTNLGHSGAIVDAANNTRIGLMDRNRQIATGGIKYNISGGGAQ